MTEHYIAMMLFDGTSDPPSVIGVFVGENALQAAKDSCQLDSMRYTHDVLPPYEEIDEDDRLEWESDPALHRGMEDDIVEWQAESGSMGTYVVQPVLIHGEFSDDCGDADCIHPGCLSADNNRYGGRAE